MHHRVKDRCGEHPVQQPGRLHLPAVEPDQSFRQGLLELLVVALAALQRVHGALLARRAVGLLGPGPHDGDVAGRVNAVRLQPGVDGVEDGVGHHPAPVDDHPAHLGAGDRDLISDSCGVLGLCPWISVIRAGTGLDRGAV